MQLCSMWWLDSWSQWIPSLQLNSDVLSSTPDTLHPTTLVMCGLGTVPIPCNRRSDGLHPRGPSTPPTLPLAPAPLPGPYRNAPGLVIAFVGAVGLVWLSETSQPHSALAAEWDSAWGGSPNSGRCQIPAVAPHNHSHTGPDTPPGWGERGKGGLGGGSGDGVCWLAHDNCKNR